jgi:two-component system, NtrC family, sensor histidine kinase HydH
VVLSAMAATLLTVAGFGFWVQSLRHEDARRRQEHRQRLSQLGEMSAVLAHEIRNPLASLKGNAQLLAERLAPGSRELQRAERVVNEATRLEALTSDLLDFARAGPVEHDAADPAALLRLAVEDVGQPGLAIDDANAPPRWTMDSKRIGQALANLLRNAVQVSPGDRPPVASVAEEAGQLVYTVRDFGPGLPDRDRERIFEPFYTTRTNGTGLGLAVARRATELHGGSISAANHPDGGAVFRLMIPRGRR